MGFAKTGMMCPEMTWEQRLLSVLAGVIVGGLGAWALGLVYLSLVDSGRGDLVVPFALIVGIGFAISVRPNLRPLAAGLVLGAAVETAFFYLLFNELEVAPGF